MMKLRQRTSADISTFEIPFFWELSRLSFQVACRHLSRWRSYFSPFIFRQPFREAASVDPQETGKKWRAENERGRYSTRRTSTRFNQPLESGKNPFFTRQFCTFFVIGLREVSSQLVCQGGHHGVSGVPGIGEGLSRQARG